MLFDTKQTLKQILTIIAAEMESAGLFFGHGTDNAWDESCWMVETLLKRKGFSDISEGALLDQSILIEIDAMLQRRLHDKIPLAYLLNEAWFMGLAFYVDERVIVPRSPFAEVIDNRFYPLIDDEPKAILDLCSGSGCIGIAAATVFTAANVDLADLSNSCIEVANINIEKHQLEGRVKTIETDLFNGLSEQYDLIISNPPYVGGIEYQALPDEYKAEPKMALFSESNGLDIPVRILKEAASYLTDNGILILELGNSWQSLEDLYSDFPFHWLDFEMGGEGLLFISKQGLENYNF